MRKAKPLKIDSFKYFNRKRKKHSFKYRGNDKRPDRRNF